MHVLIKTKSPAVSSPVNCIHSTHIAVQMSATATGLAQGQKVIADAVIEGSLDGIGWFTIAELSANGSDYATDGGAFETLWSYIRARVKSVSNNTAVEVYLAKRG